MTSLDKIYENIINFTICFNIQEEKTVNEIYALNLPLFVRIGDLLTSHLMSLTDGIVLSLPLFGYYGMRAIGMSPIQILLSVGYWSFILSSVNWG